MKYVVICDVKSPAWPKEINMHSGVSAEYAESHPAYSSASLQECLEWISKKNDIEKLERKPVTPYFIQKRERVTE